MAPDARTWIRAYAEALGVPPPSEADVDAVLDLAGAAAHASERMSAPLTCWLAAAAGLAPADALARARELASTLGEE